MRTDICDFPTAWTILEGMDYRDHNPKCSSVPGHHPLSGPHFLCDCGAVIQEWERRVENAHATDQEKTNEWS